MRGDTCRNHLLMKGIAMILPISALMSQLMSTMRGVEERHQELRIKESRHNVPVDSRSESEYVDSQYRIHVSRHMSGGMQTYIITTTISLSDYSNSTEPLVLTSRLVKSTQGNQVEIDMIDTNTKVAQPLGMDTLQAMAHSEDPAISLIASKMLTSLAANFGSAEALNRLPVKMDRAPAVRTINITVSEEEPVIELSGDVSNSSVNRALEIKTRKREIGITLTDLINLRTPHDAEQLYQYVLIQRANPGTDHQQYVLMVEHQKDAGDHTRAVCHSVTLHLGTAEQMVTLLRQKGLLLIQSEETQQQLSRMLGAAYDQQVKAVIERIDL